MGWLFKAGISRKDLIAENTKGWERTVIGRFKTSHSWALQNQQRCECSVSALKLVFRARRIAASLCFSGS